MKMRTMRTRSRRRTRKRCFEFDIRSASCQGQGKGAGLASVAFACAQVVPVARKGIGGLLSIVGCSTCAHRYTRVIREIFTEVFL